LVLVAPAAPHAEACGGNPQFLLSPDFAHDMQTTVHALWLKGKPLFQKL
jgi:hypothetical protein